MTHPTQPQDPSKYPNRGVKITQAITIDRPVEPLYAFWKNPTQVTAVMQYIESIAVTSDRTAHWVLRLPGNLKVECDVEFYTDIPNEVLSWRTLEGSQLQHAGAVRFRPAPGGRGTEVELTVEFVPPAGALGQAIVKLFGEAPAQYVREYLRDYKEVMETGEISTTEGQTSGRTDEVSQ
jgi:uncharacterized membrane protein